MHNSSLDTGLSVRNIGDNDIIMCDCWSCVVCFGLVTERHKNYRWEDDTEVQQDSHCSILRCMCALCRQPTSYRPLTSLRRMASCISRSSMWNTRGRRWVWSPKPVVLQEIPVIVISVPWTILMQVLYFDNLVYCIILNFCYSHSFIVSNKKLYYCQENSAAMVYLPFGICDQEMVWICCDICFNSHRLYEVLGRLFWVDLIKPVSNVRPSVHQNFLWFQWNFWILT